MRSPNRIILTTICILLAATVALTYLNRSHIELARAQLEKREFILKAYGEPVAEVSLQDILDLNPVEFSTRLATSTAAPRDVSLRGVELRLLYESLGADISHASLFAVRGLDGYYSPLSSKEVGTADKVYVCIAMEGKLLSDKDNGGWGPFLLVIRGERFAQRWCKYVEEIDARS